MAKEAKQRETIGLGDVIAGAAADKFSGNPFLLKLLGLERVAAARAAQRERLANGTRSRVEEATAPEKPTPAQSTREIGTWPEGVPMEITRNTKKADVVAFWNALKGVMREVDGATFGFDEGKRLRLTEKPEGTGYIVLGRRHSGVSEGSAGYFAPIHRMQLTVEHKGQSCAVTRFGGDANNPMIALGAGGRLIPLTAGDFRAVLVQKNLAKQGEEKKKRAKADGDGCGSGSEDHVGGDEGANVGGSGNGAAEGAVKGPQELTKSVSGAVDNALSAPDEGVAADENSGGQATGATEEAAPDANAWLQAVQTPLRPGREVSNDAERRGFCSALQTNATGHVVEVNNQRYILVSVRIPQSGDLTITITDAAGTQKDFNVSKISLGYVGAQLSDGQKLDTIGQPRMVNAVDFGPIERAAAQLEEGRRLLAAVAASQPKQQQPAAAEASNGKGAISATGGSAERRSGRITKLNRGGGCRYEDVENFCAHLIPNHSTVCFKLNGRGGAQYGTFVSYARGTNYINIVPMYAGAEWVSRVTPELDDIWIVD